MGEITRKNPIRRKDTRRTSLDPFSYMGVDAISPVKVVTFERYPNEPHVPPYNDYDKYNVGDFWIDRSTLPDETVWILVKKLQNVSTWVMFADIAELALQFDGDTGSAVPTALGVLGMPGSTTIQTTGAGNTITYDVMNGANGQLLISGGAAVTWANITSTGDTITITNGPNSINLETIISSGFNTLSGDIGTANPIAGTIEVLGDANITTSGDNVSTITVDLNPSIVIDGLTLSALGAGVMQTDATGLVTSNNGTNGQVLIGGGSAPAWANITSTGGTCTIANGPNTINIESAIAVGMNTLTGDSGTATPVAGNIVIAGGLNITTVGDGVNTLTVNLDDSIDIPGVLTLSALGAGVMQTNASGLVTSNNGANGQVLIGGGTAPAWANLTSTGVTVTIANGPNTINLETSGGGLGSNAFLAFQPSRLSAGSAAPYLLGSSVVLTEVYDTGADFFAGDGVGGEAAYTAPANGKYFFGYNHVTFTTDAAMPPPVALPPPPPIDPPVYHSIIAPAKYFYKYGWMFLYPTQPSARYFSVLTDLDLGDDVTFECRVGYPACQIDGNATHVRTFVCGYQVS